MEVYGKLEWRSKGGIERQYSLMIPYYQKSQALARS